jgi:hypothetical protein
MLCADKYLSFALRELPAQVRAFHFERRPDEPLAPQEVETPLRTCHSTIRGTPRCRRSHSRDSRSSHFKMQTMPIIHQPLCDIFGPGPSLAL